MNVRTAEKGGKANLKTKMDYASREINNLPDCGDNVKKTQKTYFRDVETMTFSICKREGKFYLNTIELPLKLQNLHGSVVIENEHDESTLIFEFGNESSACFCDIRQDVLIIKVNTHEEYNMESDLSHEIVSELLKVEDTLEYITFASYKNGRITLKKYEKEFAGWAVRKDTQFPVYILGKK